MDAKLRVVNGAKPAIIRLRLPTIIGRSSEANLKVRNSQVSRKHCEIDQYERELVVRDLDSANGTYVNDQRIAETTFLSPGDELRVGPLTLRAEYELAESTADQSHPCDDPNAADVVGDERAADESADSVSSILRYKEEEAGGSFLGIEEVEDDAAGSEPPADEPAAEKSPGAAAKETSPEPERTIDLETGTEQKAVDPGDSRLRDFFNNLS
jgi:pSer/pThr/pTyr-binding forkhead associated (FHA) protein